MIGKDFVHAVCILTSDIPTPELPDGFLRTMSELGRYGITSVKDMCDYTGLELQDFALILARHPKASDIYKKSRVEFKMDLVRKMYELSDLEITEKTASIVQKSIDFLLQNVGRVGINAERLDMTKKVSKEQARISKAMLKQGQKRLDLSQQEAFIKLVIDKDEETLRKIQKYTPIR